MNDAEMKSIKRIKEVKRALLAMQRWPWEQGVAAQAFLEEGDMETAVVLAIEAVTNQLEDGRLGMKYESKAACDPAVNGEPVLCLAECVSDPAMERAPGRMLDYLMNRAQKTADGILYHNEDQYQVWVDAIYMVPPFLAAMREYKEAVKQIEGMRALLIDPEKKLYRHIWDDKKKEFARPLCWGVGNGWALAGIARVISFLPFEMDAEKERLIGYERETLDACLGYLRPDGFTHDIIDDPSTFVEANLPQMLAYTIYRGAAEDWLDSGYAKTADKIREAVCEKVDRHGLVQGVCGVPHFNSPSTAPEAQAFFLLMEAARRQWRKHVN